MDRALIRLAQEKEQSHKKKESVFCAHEHHDDADPNLHLGGVLDVTRGTLGNAWYNSLKEVRCETCALRVTQHLSLSPQRAAIVLPSQSEARATYTGACCVSRARNLGGRIAPPDTSELLSS